MTGACPSTDAAPSSCNSNLGATSSPALMPGSGSATITAGPVEEARRLAGCQLVTDPLGHRVIRHSTHTQLTCTLHHFPPETLPALAWGVLADCLVLFVKWLSFVSLRRLYLSEVLQLKQLKSKCSNRSDPGPRAVGKHWKGPQGFRFFLNRAQETGVTEQRNAKNSPAPMQN